MFINYLLNSVFMYYMRVLEYKELALFFLSFL
jgi:hypothetical protein